MSITRFFKDPIATLDYTVNWSTWLGLDTITTSSWSVPTGLTSSNVSSTTTTATVFLSGGVLGTTYEVANTIVTTGGRTNTRHLDIAISNQ